MAQLMKLTDLIACPGKSPLLQIRQGQLTAEGGPDAGRTEDIPLLARRFARRLLRRLPDQPLDDVVPAEALAALSGHRWPGNVRELRNHVQRVMALADPHLPPERPRPAFATGVHGDAGSDLDQPFRSAKEQAVGQLEASHLRQLLHRADGNISAAARRGAEDRAHLYKLLR